MSQVYLIKPLEKKSVEAVYEMFRENKDGSTSWFNLKETFRWGQGFVEADMDCNLPFNGDSTAYCKSDCGWGAELDDSVAIEWEFSDDLSAAEQQAIKDAYSAGGAGWLYDGVHDWQFEDDYILVLAPYKVSLVDEETQEVVTEKVALRTRPDPKQAWPF